MIRLLMTGLAVLACGCSDNLTPTSGSDLDPVYGCLPDGDGVITAGELPVMIGRDAEFYESPPQEIRMVDVSGTGAGEDRVWDFSTEYADDRIVSIGPQPLSGRWYQGEFAGGQFITSDGTYDSIYHLDQAGLWLHGLASTDPEPAVGQTLWRYEQPVALIRLPLSDGDEWTEVGVVTDGRVQGLPYRTTDTYQLTADGRGRLEVPYLRFNPVLRLRSHVTVMPEAGGIAISRRQVSFLFECFGEVGRIESLPDEPSVDFERAAYVRRFVL